MRKIFSLVFILSLASGLFINKSFADGKNANCEHAKSDNLSDNKYKKLLAYIGNKGKKQKKRKLEETTGQK